MITNTYQLGEALETVVDALVKAGRYASRHDVLREGVRLVEERERRLTTVDAALSRGIADAEAGRVMPLDDIAARLIARYAALDDEHGG